MVRSQLWLNKSTQLFILCHFQLASLKLQLFVVGFFFFFFLMLCYVIIFLHFAVSFHPAHELTQSFSQPTPLEGCPCPHPQGHASQLLLFPLTALTLLIFLFSPMYFFFLLLLLVWSSMPLCISSSRPSQIQEACLQWIPASFVAVSNSILGPLIIIIGSTFWFCVHGLGTLFFFCLLKPLFITLFICSSLYAGGMSEAGRIMCQCKYLSLP